MKFQINTKDLRKALLNAKLVLTTKSSLPVIENILIETKDNEVILTVTDLENTIIISLENVTIIEKGSIIAPGKLLIDTIKTIPDIDITFSSTEVSRYIGIAGDSYQFTMIGSESDNFPKAVSINENNFSIPEDILYNGINNTINYRLNDDLRPNMTGVYVEFSNYTITFCATDGYRLCEYIANSSNDVVDLCFILNGKYASILKNICDKKSKESISCSFKDNKLMMKIGNITLLTKTIDHKFPSYRVVIPTNNQSLLTVDRLSLLNTIKQLSSYTNYQGMVSFNVSNDTLSLKAEDDIKKTKVILKVSCETLDLEDNYKIGFNDKLLISILSNLSCKDVTFKLSLPTRGVLIGTDDNNLTILLMPLMLPS